MTDTVLTRSARHEAAMTMITAVIAMVIAAVVIAGIGVMTMSSLDQSKQLADHVGALPAVEAGIDAYGFSLQNDRITERQDYVLTEAVLREMVDGGSLGIGAALLPNSDPSIPHSADRNYQVVDGVWAGATTLTRIPDASLTNYRWTVRVPSASDQYTFWQIRRIVLPNYSTPTGSNLAVFFRGWMASLDGSGATRARTVRAEYRPGTFADYQMVSDMQLAFEDGASINGPIHSNGFESSFLLGAPDSAPANTRVWASGELACGPDAQITTPAPGDFYKVPDACHKANGGFISFLRTQESFAQMRLSEADPEVWVLPAADLDYTVILNGYSASVTSGEGATTTIPVNRSTTILIEDDVKVRGFVSGRLTLAAERDEATDSAAANITVIDDTGRDTTAGAVLGLVAEGDIVIGGGSSCPVESVKAAMLAMTGSVSVGRDWFTKSAHAARPQCDGKLSIEGSIASHESPIFLWTYGGWEVDGGPAIAFTYAGYLQREYLWDKSLRHNAPPFFPLSGQWQIASWKEANADCLTIRQGDPKCR